MPRITWFSSTVFVFLLSAMALIPINTTQAGTFTASTAAELIAAINAANANGEADTITLTEDITLTAVADTIDGANGLPSITSDITIEGGGFTIARDESAPDFRIIHVEPTGVLALNNLTLSNGSITSGETIPCGGAINVLEGILTLNNSTVSGNSSNDNGGGICNSNGVLTLNNSTISGNSAPDLGGGLWNRGTAILSNSTLSGNTAIVGGGIFTTGRTMTLEHSAVTDNNAGVWGGGIYNLGIMEITYSTISGNSSAWYGGGGIWADGLVTIGYSTVSGNSAIGDGGGIHNESIMTLFDSTLSGNSATNDGGGFYNDLGRVTVTNTTFSGNSATNSGGGLYSGGAMEVSSSTLSGNSATNGGGIYSSYLLHVTLNNSIITNSTGGDCFAADTDGFVGANNLGGDDCASISVGTVTNLDPMLADNGGPTLTHALRVNSNAIDAVPLGYCTVATDQRGYPRNLLCDIGAYEIAASPMVINEQELQNQLQTEIAQNPAVQDIEVAVVDFVPGTLNLTIRTTDGTEGDIVVTATDNGSGFVSLAITSVTVRDEGPLHTYRAAINRELMPLLVASIDQLILLTPWLNLDSMTVTDTHIIATILR